MAATAGVLRHHGRGTTWPRQDQGPGPVRGRSPCIYVAKLTDLSLPKIGQALRPRPHHSDVRARRKSSPRWPQRREIFDHVKALTTRDSPALQALKFARDSKKTSISATNICHTISCRYGCAQTAHTLAPTTGSVHNRERSPIDAHEPHNPGPVSCTTQSAPPAAQDVMLSPTCTGLITVIEISTSFLL